MTKREPMIPRTKIVATIGPASQKKSVLLNMMDAGMSVARINMSHGSLDSGLDLFYKLRKLSKEYNKPLAVLADLPGPKVRAGSFGKNGVKTTTGDKIRLVPGTCTSTKKLVHVDYEGLLTDLEEGDEIIFGDGGSLAVITSVEDNCLKATVTHGGTLRGNPGVYIPSDRLKLATPTKIDLKYADAFVEKGIDMLALSFVKSASNIRLLGVETHPEGPLIVAKIETKAAIKNLEGIIGASGAIMVARGDLGTEFPIEQLPHLQKEIISRCLALGRPVITATQMLESMVSAPSPTRAEASDVANAVFDGSSAVMLSGETAIGHDPANVITTMQKITAHADNQFGYDQWAAEMVRTYLSEPEGLDAKATDGMTSATVNLAKDMGARVIITITRSGFAARAIARFRPEMPIVAFTPNSRVYNQLLVSWGVTPMMVDTISKNEETVDKCIAACKEAGLVYPRDLVVVLGGISGKSTSTDMLRLIRI